LRRDLNLWNRELIWLAVANAKKTPPKRRVQGGRVTPKGGAAREELAESASAEGTKQDSARATGKDSAKGKPGSRARTKTPPKPTSRTATSGRYTPPADRSYELPSPPWVPVLMFTFWILGMLVIFLNYVGLLPGAVSNWYLLVGLGLILAGIITATQYR
jgi:hypothetical protein